LEGLAICTAPRQDNTSVSATKAAQDGGDK
jgi:hypothetical protein